ncbi:MAG: hypothetical protein GY842_13110, partial [bacterium]|nr:hypothetical protein [bacterium]
MKFRPGWLAFGPFQKTAVDGAAGTTTAAQYMGKAPCEAQVVEVDFLPQDALVADDTDYATLYVKNGSTTVASITTKELASGGSGDWVAGTAVPLTLSTTPGDSELAEDDVLNWSIAKAASGVAVPAGAFQVLS